MRLVVCVDRDDDLGRKAGVVGPVVGRAAVLEAAQRLGVADPEDSDTNAMYGAVRLLDTLRAQLNEEVEVVVLTGSPKVGVLSDRKIAEQFDRVLAQTPAEGFHLITDGAEDEYIAPVLHSRLKLDGIHRIHIRQSASLESTYYTIQKALKDPKLRHKTVLPLALVMIIIGIAAITGVFWLGFWALVIIVGVYGILWIFDIDESIIDSLRSASSDLRTGSVSFGFGLFALSLAGIGLLLGDSSYNDLARASIIQRSLGFLEAGLLPWIAAGFVWECGRAIRFYLARSRIPKSFVIASLSIVGIGLLSYALLQLVAFFESFPAEPLPVIVAALLGGLAIMIAAGAVSQYLKRVVTVTPTVS